MHTLNLDSFSPGGGELASIPSSTEVTGLQPGATTGPVITASNVSAASMRFDIPCHSKAKKSKKKIPLHTGEEVDIDLATLAASTAFAAAVAATGATASSINAGVTAGGAAAASSAGGDSATALGAAAGGGDSPVLWIRVDPEMRLIRELRLEQPDHHWQLELRYERDIGAQVSLAIV